MSADPFLCSGSYFPKKFSECALHKGFSPNALKPVSKIELLKDTRKKDHWCHEFLVFTVAEEVHLYFERELDDDVEGLKRKAAFAWRFFRGAAYDNLEFLEAGCEEDVEKRAWIKPVFEIKLGPSALTLKDLAIILDREAYTNKYTEYGLFSANCWAWSRGFLFDIIRHPHAATAEIWKTNGNGMVFITLEETKLCMLTEYGAYGRLLLYFTSDEYDAQSRTRAFPEFFNPYAIWFILLLYSILPSLVYFKSLIIGPSNWTVCLRTLLVYHDRTLDASTDCTFLPSRPNFTDFIPVIDGYMDHPIPSSFCQPGRYLYLLTSPVYSASRPISSVHVYVFGAISNIPANNDVGFTHSPQNENPRQDPTSWLSCGIIRYSEADGKPVELANSLVRLDVIPRGATEPLAPAEYSSIRVFDSDDLTAKIRNGDMIALWVHSPSGHLHIPRSASIKVVVSRRPVRMLDWTLASLLLFEFGRSIYFGGSYMSLAFGTIGYSLYWTNTFCEKWLWTTLSAFAKVMQASITPLSLPTDPISVVSFTLPEFIQERTSTAGTITSDILSASLCSMELFHDEKSGNETVLVSFSHRDANYNIHFTGASAVHAGWLHFLSFFFSTHRLELDEVKIFRDCCTERIIRECLADQSILRIEFNTGESFCRNRTDFEPTLQSIVKRLRGIQKHYWWYFWLNSRYWTWQRWLLQTLLRETVAVQKYVAVESRQCSHDRAATLLRDKFKQWRYADMKEYTMGLPSLDDVLFVVTQTRSIWIILFVFASAKAFDWYSHS